MTSPLVRLRSGLLLAHTRLRRLSAAPERMRRRRHARSLSSTTPDTVTEQAALFPAELKRDGFSPARLAPERVSAMLEDWRALELQCGARGTRVEYPRTTGKAFFDELLLEDDLARYPAFVAAALDPPVLRTVMQAMDMVPHLESVDILASIPGAHAPSASQLWHYDVNDERIVKLFVYLEECGPENGPFTFIPAGPSRRVRAAVGHYVPDDRIASHVPRTEWRTVEGAAGSAFFIDTGRCYHFGSRCTQRRVAYIATYSSGLKFMKRSKLWPDKLRSRMSDLPPLQRMVCAIDG
jgi:hypothetical protein